MGGECVCAPARTATGDDEDPPKRSVIESTAAIVGMSAAADIKREKLGTRETWACNAEYFGQERKPPHWIERREEKASWFLRRRNDTQAFGMHRTVVSLKLGT